VDWAGGGDTQDQQVERALQEVRFLWRHHDT
jgi:hypothetical protein